MPAMTLCKKLCLCCTVVSQAWIDVASNSCPNYSFHWSDLHRMLFNSLPEGTVRFSHKVVAYNRSGDSLLITAEASGEPSSTRDVKFTADLLVAADGSNSTIRRLMYPEDKRRFASLTHTVQS